MQTRRTDEENRVTAYTHDLRDRLSVVDYGEDGPDRRYSYDAMDNIIAVTEGAPAAPSTVQDKRNVAYLYDENYRLVGETSGATHDIDGVGELTAVTGGLTHTYGYDLAGNRLLTTYAGGTQLLSTYDDLNRTLDIVEDDDADETIDAGERKTTYTYDLAGNIHEKVAGNGLVTRKTFDALNRASLIQSVEVPPPPAPEVIRFGFTQEYDPYGNLAHLLEDYADAPTAHLADRTVTLTYDGADRLLTETTATTGGATVTSTYLYDKANNREKLTVDDGTDTTVTDYTFSNSLNQITSYTVELNAALQKTVEFVYGFAGGRETRTTKDPAGAVTGFDRYTYDFEQRLLDLDHWDGPEVGDPDSENEYLYDYRTRRVLRKVLPLAAGEYTEVSFSGGLSVQERYLLGNLKAEYVRGSDYGGGVGGILYSLRGAGPAPSYYHFNGRGDVVAKADDTGSLTYQAAYEAFGTHAASDPRTQEWEDAQSPNADPHRANTKEEDPTGLLNEGFRYRDLEAGVFITRDPLGFVDGPNVYAYVVQNPWSRFDPRGLKGNALSKLAASLGAKSVRNAKFAGRNDVTADVLRNTPSSKVDPARLARIDEKFPGLKVAYSSVEDGVKIKFPEEAIGGRVKSPFGSNDKTNAWNKYKEELIKDHGEKKGTKMFDSAKQNYEMHHSYDEGVFELVDADVHKAFAHTGGDKWYKAGLLDVGAALAPNLAKAQVNAESNADVAMAAGVDFALLMDPAFSSVAGASGAATDAYLEGQNAREAERGTQRQQWHFDRAKSAGLTIPEYRKRGGFRMTSGMPDELRD